MTLVQAWTLLTIDNKNLVLVVVLVSESKALYLRLAKGAVSWQVFCPAACCHSRSFIPNRISPVGRALDCRAGGRRTNTQGLKITEKWRYYSTFVLQTARSSRGSDDYVKWRSRLKKDTYFSAEYIDTQIKCLFSPAIYHELTLSFCFRVTTGKELT